jgi:hypothetical protein
VRPVRIVRFATALLTLILLAAAPAVGHAAPSADELEAAKEAFGKGKALYDKGDKKAAVEEFKQSYRLSKNPVLLYNIGLCYDEIGDKALALHYYQKFLAEAPDSDKTVENKKLATGRVDVLKKELAAEDDKGTPKPPVVTPPAPGGEGALQKSGVKEFTHAVVDEAPPGKPLDLTAKIPDDAGDWKLTVYYRPQGQDDFVAVKMRPRYDELVGRITAKAVKGNSIQYYVEVKDAGGAMIKRSGSPGSPNIVYIDKAAAPHYYKDLEPLDKPAATGKPEPTAPPEDTGTTGEGLDEEDPLTGRKPRPPTASSDDETATAVDRPSNTRKWLKWGATGGAVVLLGAGVFFYLNAKSFAREIEAESTHCGTPPCQVYDSYVADLESTGAQRQMLSNVTLIGGVALAGVAGYFWYKDIFGQKKPARAVTRPTGDEGDDGGTGDDEPTMPDASMTFTATPLLGPGFVGASAIIEF